MTHVGMRWPVYLGRSAPVLLGARRALPPGYCWGGHLGCSACLCLRRSGRMIRRSWVVRAVPAAAISRAPAMAARSRATALADAQPGRRRVAGLVAVPGHGHGLAGVRPGLAFAADVRHRGDHDHGDDGDQNEEEHGPLLPAAPGAPGRCRRAVFPQVSKSKVSWSACRARAAKKRLAAGQVQWHAGPDIVRAAAAGMGHADAGRAHPG
jgi:hypothetical protein